MGDDQEESLQEKDPHIGALLNKLGGSISGRNLTVRGTQVICACPGDLCMARKMVQRCRRRRR